MYSTHNEGKSVIVERCIRTLKNKIYKHMTSISKNVYIDKLNDIIYEYNNAYHRTSLVIIMSKILILIINILNLISVIM